MDSNEQGCASLGNASPTPTAAPCSRPGGPKSIATPMWRRYADRTPHPSIFSQADSHARTSVELGNVPGLQASKADYGLTTPASSANYDPGTCSWRTSQVSLFGGWAEFSATWPMAGSMRNGTSYRLRPSAPRTYELASGFWPTPVASETKRTTPYSQGGQSLSFTLGGRPSQAFLEWLMGFPDGWCTPSETPSSPPAQNTSDES